MKRSSERQITKDDPESSEDERNIGTEQAFERASAEVMAQRRIIRGRRSLSASQSCSDAAKSTRANPFAGVLSCTQNGVLSALQASSATEGTEQSATADSKSPTNPNREEDEENAQAGNVAEVQVTQAAKGNEDETTSTGNEIHAFSSVKGLAVAVDHNPANGHSKNDDQVSSSQASGAQSRFSVPDVGVKSEVIDSAKSSDTKNSTSILEGAERRDAGQDAPQKILTSERQDLAPLEGQGDEESRNLSDCFIAGKKATSENSKSGAKADQQSCPNDCADSRAQNKSVASSSAQNDDKNELHGQAESTEDLIGKPGDESGGHSLANNSDSALPFPVPVSTADEKSGAPLQKAFAFGGVGTGTPITTFGDAAIGATGFSFPKTTLGQQSTESRCGTKADQSTKFEQKEVVTGEEDEEEKFRARCKLYLFEDSKWVERGVGYMKLNVNMKTGKFRLVMRTEATLRLILNTPVTDSISVDRATEKSVRFAGQLPDDCARQALYLARFGLKDDLDRFMIALTDIKEKCVGKNEHRIPSTKD